MKIICWIIISLIIDINIDLDIKVIILVKLDFDCDKWFLILNNLINFFYFDFVMYLIYKVLN